MLVTMFLIACVILFFVGVFWAFGILATLVKWGAILFFLWVIFKVLFDMLF